MDIHSNQSLDDDDGTEDEEDSVPTLPTNATYQERLDFEAQLMQRLATKELNPDARQHYQRLSAQATAAATAARSPTYEAERQERQSSVEEFFRRCKAAEAEQEQEPVPSEIPSSDNNIDGESDTEIDQNQAQAQASSQSTNNNETEIEESSDNDSEYPTNLLWSCDVCKKQDTEGGGKSTSMMTCGRCKAVQYCSRQCQKKDWKEGGHKSKCGKYAEGCYCYMPSWGVSIQWLTLRERREGFQSLQAYGWTYEEAMEFRFDNDNDEFWFLQMVDDEREDEDRSCYDEHDEEGVTVDKKNGKDGEDEEDSCADRPLIPHWKNEGYASEDDYVLHEVDGVRNMEELVCDTFGVPRLIAIGNDVEGKLSRAGLEFLGYKPGRDYGIDGTSIQVGKRVIMSDCSCNVFREGR